MFYRQDETNPIMNFFSDVVIFSKHWIHVSDILLWTTQTPRATDQEFLRWKRADQLGPVCIAPKREYYPKVVMLKNLDNVFQTVSNFQTSLKSNLMEPSPSPHPDKTVWLRCGGMEYCSTLALYEISTQSFLHDL